MHMILYLLYNLIVLYMINIPDSTLLSTFCPLVYLHSQEKVRPTKIQDFLKFSTIQKDTYKYVGTYTPPTDSIDDVPFYGKVDHDVMTGGASLLYMFMYSYNSPYKILGCISVGAHDADLEHVRVEIDGNLKITSVQFGQHSVDSTITALENLDWLDKDRMIVYSARGIHASYPKPGLKLRWNTALFANDRCDKGFEWNRKGTVEPWPTDIRQTRLGVSTNNTPLQWWWVV